MQASLQAMQERTRCASPRRSFSGVSGSAMSCRAKPMRSASPAASISSARLGGAMRPKATTGSRLCFFSAAFSPRKLPAVTAAGGISIQ